MSKYNTVELHKLNPRELIARRCAQELNSGEVVNLGIGIPTQTANYLPEGADIIFHSENGVFGFGPKPKIADVDSDLTNAGCEPISLNDGAAIMDLTTSLGAMRKGYIDTTILGGLQVDQLGNLANWAVKREGLWWPGIGGAMDLCYGTKKVVVAINHMDKNGNSKLRKRCDLPLTGKNCVSVIITDKAVFDVSDGVLILREILPGITRNDIRNWTDADIVLSPNLCEMSIDLSIGVA